MSHDDNGQDQHWKGKVRQAAIQFASTVHFGFRQAMNNTLKLLPVDAPDTRVEQLNSFMDCMVGVTCAVGVEYVGAADLVTEEQMIKLVREKFRMLRQAQLADITTPRTRQ
jgi:hypothetical protein